MLEAFQMPRALAQKGFALLTGLLTVASLSLVPASQVEAKKFGGGMSIGKSAPVKKAPPPAAPAAPSAATPAKPNAAQTPGNAPAGQAAAAPAAAGAAGTAAAAGAATRSSWMGPLVGIAAGLGLAALASHLGLGEELMSLLLIVLFVVAAVFIVRLIMSRGRASSGMPEPAMARSSSGYGAGSMSGGSWSSQPESAPRPASAPVFDQSSGLQNSPAAYQQAEPAAQDISEEDIQAFLNVARQQFMAMQKLWDSGDLSQIESFCTPAMAVEIRRQLDERGDAPNQTSVVQLELEWLGLESATDDDGLAVEEAYIRFYGLVREESNGTANAFDEVWLLQKPADGRSGWLLAGITQQGAH